MSQSQPPDPERSSLSGRESGVASTVRALRWMARNRRRRIVLTVVGACVLVLTVSFALSQRATGRAMAGVHVMDVDVSRLTREEVRERVSAWAAQRGALMLTLSVAGAPLRFEAKSAGFLVDADEAADRALAVGRDGAIHVRFASFVLRWFRPQAVPVTLGFDPARLERVLDEWQSKISDPPFAGGMALNGTSATPLYPRAGTVLDRARVEAQLKDAIAAGHGGAALATRSESPKTDRAEVERVVALAQSMLTSDVELRAADGVHQLTFTPAELASVLRVKPGPEPAKLTLTCAIEALQPLLAARRGTLEQPPENAKFAIDAQDRVHVEPGHGAHVLDDAAVANAVCAAAQSTAKKAELPLRPGPEPALSTEVAEHLGVAGLMGSYTTRHACCQPRVQNIHHIADLLDGILVKPGETFSVNQVVGQRSVKNGFHLAPSIEDGDMVDTVGGGVSQFATTLFNALFYGGYDILERQPHTYWFTRYPEGYDATLSYPHPDIVFKNDTEAGALIKTSYTDTTITVKIYGNNGGRKVRAEVSARQNIVPPPLEYIPNRRLDPDKEKTREGGMIGWTVIVKRTLTFPDGKIKEERRKVTYKPRARRVEVHPCKIPVGEPGHTGEKCPKPDPDRADDSGATDGSAK